MFLFERSNEHTQNPTHTHTHTHHFAMGGGASKEQKYKQSSNTSVEKIAAAATEPRGSVLDHDDSDEAPEFLTCPLSYEVMRDPVFTADGHTFERHIIEEWLRDHDTNPMTNSKMTHKDLTPNFAIREACAAYRQKNPSNAESIKRYNAAVAKVQKSTPSQKSETPSSAFPSSSSSSSSSSSFSATPTSTAAHRNFSAATHTNTNTANHFTAHTTAHTATPTRTADATRSATRRAPSFDFAEYGTSPTASRTPQHRPSYNSGRSSNGGSGDNGTQCSLCTNQAVTKAKIGPNEWIKVCDGCSRVVAAQRDHAGGSPSSARFRSVSATEAAQQALTASMSPTSSGMPRSGSSNIRRHASSLVGTTNGSSGGLAHATNASSPTSGIGTMSCAHCRQQAVCQRATDIDGSQLWLCPGCADTQRQFSQAHAAASPVHGNGNGSSVVAAQATTPIATTPHRRQTFNPDGRGLYLQNALGSSAQTTTMPLTSPQACHDRAWNRAEAMELLEQHEWSRANTSSANEMADQLNDRYADTIQRGASQIQGHAHDCVCGLCSNKR